MRDPDIDYDEIVQICAFLNVRKAARTLTRLFDSALQPGGMRVTQFSVLIAVRRLSPVSINVLADDLSLDRSTLARNLKPLEAQGWIETAPGHDRRERIVTLTDRGSHILDDNVPLWTEAQAQIVQVLGETRLQTLLAELAVLRSLDSHLSE